MNWPNPPGPTGPTEPAPISPGANGPSVYDRYTKLGDQMCKNCYRDDVNEALENTKWTAARLFWPTILAILAMSATGFVWHSCTETAQVSQEQFGGWPLKSSRF